MKLPHVVEERFLMTLAVMHVQHQIPMRRPDFSAWRYSVCVAEYRLFNGRPYFRPMMPM
jgi:hypothetical protein